MFQFAALFDSMTVAENIRLGLVRRGHDEREIRERVAESLAVVELAGTEDKYPAELSGGMRKRVGIARAIALRPRYILYDEPTTGLDPVTSAVMDQLMIRTRDLGVTGLVVTHDMRSAFTVGDRIAMLYEGAIRQVGSVEEIRATGDPVVRQFIEGRPGDAGRGGEDPMKRSNEFAVGLAVLAALALVIFGALWLSETDVNQKEATYTARFRTVGGLGVGAPVTLRGVRVGRVEAIRLVENEWVETEFSVDREVDLPPKPAVISASASLFGEWSANIVPFEPLPTDPNVRGGADRVRPGRRRSLARRDPARHRPAHRPGQPHRR